MAVEREERHPNCTQDLNTAAQNKIGVYTRKYCQSLTLVIKPEPRIISSSLCFSFFALFPKGAIHYHLLSIDQKNECYYLLDFCFLLNLTEVSSYLFICKTMLVTFNFTKLIWIKIWQQMCREMIL